ATAGMIICLKVPEPCTGSHCKFTAKTSISMMPSQKLGVARPRLANTLQKLSSQVLTRTAEKIPRGMPRTMETAMADPANGRQAGNLCIYNSNTGTRYINDLSKFPRDSLPIQTIYCSTYVLSSP